MDTKLERFSRGLEKTASAIVLILTLAFILGLTAAAFWETSLLNTEDASGENIEFYTDNIFLNIILLALFLSAAYLFFLHCGGIRFRRMENVLLFWTFALGTAYIATTKLRAPSYSDSFLVTYGAQRAAVGDYSILAVAVSYLLQVIDANVFAYMQDFEVNDEISMKVSPSVIPMGDYAHTPPAVGMSIGLKF